MRNSAARIPDDAAETILTVGDAVKFLEKNAKSDPVRFAVIPAVAARRALRARRFWRARLHQRS